MSRVISTVVQEALQQEEVTTRMLIEVYLRTADIPTNTLNTITKQISIEGDYVVFRFLANDTQDLIIPNECTDVNFRGKTYINAEVDRGNIDTSVDGAIEKNLY